MFDDEFWLSEVQQSFDSPDIKWVYQKRSDQFYVTKPTGFAVFMASIGILAYLVLEAWPE